MLGRDGIGGSPRLPPPGVLLEQSIKNRGGNQFVLEGGGEVYYILHEKPFTNLLPRLVFLMFPFNYCGFQIYLVFKGNQCSHFYEFFSTDNDAEIVIVVCSQWSRNLLSLTE